MLLIRRRVRRFYKSWWLDGLIAVLAVATSATALIFAPLQRITGGNADVVAVTLAYPVADVVMVALLVGVFADELKIDRSFVMAMTESSDDDVIVRSTALLGRNLGLGVVAEGVETAEHLERVGAYGCTVAQGYHLSRPVASDELVRRLQGVRSGGDRFKRVRAVRRLDRVLEQ